MNAAAAFVSCLLLAQLATDTESHAHSNLPELKTNWTSSADSDTPAQPAKPAGNVPFGPAAPSPPAADINSLSTEDTNPPTEGTNPLPGDTGLPRQPDPGDDSQANSAGSILVQSPKNSTSGSKPRDKTPLDWFAEVLALPQQSEIHGQEISLVEALSPAQGHLARRKVLDTYWRLVQAVGDYRSIFDQCRFIESFPDTAETDWTLRMARTSALAALHRAELAVVAAQYELADAALLPHDSSLPLPADLPHAGRYQTHFEQIFSQRVAPRRAWLANRALPIGSRAIGFRLQAFEAAGDALDAAAEAYRFGQCDIATVVSYAAERDQQQRALVTSACQYNHDIAEYALAVSEPQTDPRKLVAMLIPSDRRLSSRPPADTTASREKSTQSEPPDSRAEPSAVQQATLNVPTDDGFANLLRSTGVRNPTLAPPRDLGLPLNAFTTTPVGPSSESSVLHRQEAISGDGSSNPSTSAPPASPDLLIPRTTYKPSLSATESALSDAVGIYPALADKKPAVQAKQLAASLHWIRLLPEPSGEPIALGQCLRDLPRPAQQAMVTKYWLVAQRAAEYQAWIVERNFLEELAILITTDNASQNASSPTDRLRLFQTATEAQLLEAHRRFLESQSELTAALGRPLSSPWTLPATSPHCGPYLLNLDAQPRATVESWHMRQLTATIPSLAGGLAQHATAVVQADSTRAAVTTAYESGDRSLDQVLAAIEAQTRQTLAFLDMLGTYNRSIGEYALTVLPLDVSEDQLVGALVLE